MCPVAGRDVQSRFKLIGIGEERCKSGRLTGVSYNVREREVDMSMVRCACIVPSHGAERSPLAS